MQHLTSSLPSSLALNRWCIYMHHCSDEFDPHGHLFLLCIKEKQQDYFVLANTDFRTIIVSLVNPLVLLRKLIFMRE